MQIAQAVIAALMTCCGLYVVVSEMLMFSTRPLWLVTVAVFAAVIGSSWFGWAIEPLVGG